MAGARPVERPAALAAELARWSTGPAGVEELGVWTGSGARPKELGCTWPAGEDELARDGASREGGRDGSAQPRSVADSLQRRGEARGGGWGWPVLDRLSARLL